MQTNTPTMPKAPIHKTPTKAGSATPDSNNLKSFFQNLLAKNAPNNNTNANINQISQSPNSISSNTVNSTPLLPTEQSREFNFNS